MRSLLATSLILATFLTASLLAAGAPPAVGKPKNPKAAASEFAAREVVALGFVHDNHPELADLLEQLKAMKPEQYERAVGELWQTSRVMANLAKNDPRRQQAALDVWKARSRADLLAAQIVGTSGNEKRGELRAAIELQADAELRQQRLERELLRARLRKVDESIERLETNRDSLIESRTENLLKRGQRARRLDAGRATPDRPATVKGDD